jgi:hypothetical protein
MADWNTRSRMPVLVTCVIVRVWSQLHVHCCCRYSGQQGQGSWLGQKPMARCCLTPITDKRTNICEHPTAAMHAGDALGEIW